MSNVALAGGIRLYAVRLYAVVVAVVVSLAAPAVAQEQGAPRIVSTSPSITEVLFALGLGPQVVGVSSFCRYPAEAAALPKVGTFLRPNAELIARLRPGLAIVNSGANDVPRQLSVLGIRSITVSDARTVPGIYTMIRSVGTAAGVAGRAEQLVTDIQRRLDRVRAGAVTTPRKVLVVVGRTPGTRT